MSPTLKMLCSASGTLLNYIVLQIYPFFQAGRNLRITFTENHEYILENKTLKNQQGRQVIECSLCLLLMSVFSASDLQSKSKIKIFSVSQPYGLLFC